MRLKLDLQYFAADEKTEKATPKKKQDSRKKGQVAKSQDVNTGFLLLLTFSTLYLIGPMLKDTLLTMYEQSFTEYIHLDITEQTVSHVLNKMSLEISKVLAPVMGIAIVAGLTSNLIQVGVMFTAEPLKVDPKKLNPIQGFKRIFSARALVELVKSLLKITVIGVITFSVIWTNKNDMIMSAQKSLDAALSFFGNTTMIMGLASAMALLLLSVIDYTYQKYDHEKNIRMSKKDIKDEYKNMEGDPQIRAKIKEKQRQMSAARMMSEVPEADVIITNPTHYAVALKYNEQKSDAPFVVAKGVDFIALKIKETARAHDVITVENRPLARGLYSRTEINEPIEEEFFQAVAEVLAYVYKLQKKV
ncbi:MULTISPECIES: flagellar biosynthesis protein FlhB [Salimicrobium]|uniref:Flagellar biosynthetic protein FlhB n=2 Tax=Salimicrobium TaxID=351195 RepID=K2HB35_9BACI|nr:MULTISPECIES: flagellar biosynthesis protein FlhB [Salimicrobium]AKG04560.1 flagellar biosynthesis protein FlhB [Salimicrobium jeotgali]EKE32775.1 flagellar biosynthesis protein FlhB [Salimicrobium jeotgali]MBM7695237.1 flagellar biosynthetic protein FlhB [Salimicrobium jeotgali]SDX30776.1 flagellar biosynthetic protein FlhB [Salimicrobium album]